MSSEPYHLLSYYLSVLLSFCLNANIVFRGQTPPCSEASSSKILQVNCASSLQAKVFGGPGPQCEGTGPFFRRCLAATFCTVDPGPPTKLVQTSRVDRPYQLNKNEV